MAAQWGEPDASKVPEEVMQEYATDMVEREMNLQELADRLLPLVKAYIEEKNFRTSIMTLFLI